MMEREGQAQAGADRVAAGQAAPAADPTRSGAPPGDGRLCDGLAFATAVAFAAWLAAAVRLYPADSFWPAYLTGTAMAAVCARSSSPFFESIFVVVPWFLAGGATHSNPAALYLPLAAFVLMTAAGATRSRVLAGLVLPLCAAWFAAAGGLDAGPFGAWGVALVAATAVQLAIFADFALRAPWPPPRVVDLVLNSASGNTAHYAQAFLTGLRAAGVEVREHRLHDHHEFRPALDGDALVLAFPVGGWKPPWPLVAWLLLDLPWGRGKPAFCLYTAGGGPENAGLVAWLLLRLRGYRPVGRAWASYPLNVVTLRIGPARMCTRRLPSRAVLAAASRLAPWPSRQRSLTRG